MSFDPSIHHRKSIRLKGYDYSREGLYFITICTQDRKCLFGEIVDGKMILNDFGKNADKCWLDIPKHFPNAILHEHIVMPNHVHGIIELTQGREGNVGAENFLPLRGTTPHSIGSIVKGFKIGVTKFFRNNYESIGDPKPAHIWQRNYHEHIIRNEKSYQRISEYIINNPDRWSDDKFYTR